MTSSPNDIRTVDIEGIRQRVNAATPGPWYAWDRGVGYMIALDPDGDRVLPEAMRTDLARAGDAEFIAKARSDVPALLDEVERLRKEVGLLARWMFGNVTADEAHRAIALGRAHKGDAPIPDADPT